MNGAGGNDCILGGGGNEITGGSGTDVCIGGPGTDTFTGCETSIQSPLEQFVEEVRGNDPALASYLRIEEGATRQWP